MLDLLIKNGRNVAGEPLEIGITDGKISHVSAKIEEEAEKVLRLTDDAIISAGWIDSHVHCYEKMTLYYDFPDEIGVKKGVTTVIDAGSTGEANIKDFYELAKKAATNVYALLNISKWGIIKQDELSDLGNINLETDKERIQELSDFIIGIKARMSRTVVGNNDVIPLKMAKELQKELADLPLMVHIGSAPPELSDILALLEAGDIVTHCYNGKLNGIMSEEGKIKDFVWDAYKRGIIFDIGHGTDSFNFSVAQEALDEGVICRTISTDIYHRNRENGPVFDFSTTLEKMLLLGLSLETVIDMVTKNPAEIFHLTEKGQLAVGKDGDITVFHVTDKEKMLIDSNGNQTSVNQTVEPLYAIVAGNVYPISKE